MVLRRDQEKDGGDKLGSKWQLQRPQEAGDDQQPGQAKDEVKNRESPSAGLLGIVDRTTRHSSKRNSPRQECRGLKWSENRSAARMPQTDVSYLMT